MTDKTSAGSSKECLHGQLIRGDTGPWYCASPDCGFTIWPQSTAPETPVQSPLWAFVERVATYSDYTHDDVDELKILKDIQAAAAFLYGDGSGTQRTLQQTGWWQCPCCQNYYTPERLVCPVSGDYRPLKANLRESIDRLRAIRSEHGNNPLSCAQCHSAPAAAEGSTSPPSHEGDASATVGADSPPSNGNPP